MWMWSSARFKAAAASVLILAALAACNRDDPAEEGGFMSGGSLVAPDPIQPDAVPEEEPAVARQQWRAANDAARSVAGNLRVSIQAVRGGPVTFAFANGVTVDAQPINVMPSNQRSGVGAQSFAALLGGDPRVNVHLYRVRNENVTRAASAGGLCGAEPTRHLAVSEFVDSGGRWVFKIAAFRGERPPGVSGEDPLLCNAYAYVIPT